MLGFAVLEGSLFVTIIIMDATKNAFANLAFYLQSSRVIEKRSNKKADN